MKNDESKKINNKFTIFEGLSLIIYKLLLKYEDFEKIKIPNSITNIEDDLFSNHKRLHQVKLSKNLETIGKRAFLSCFYLKTIDLPNNLKKIKKEAFRECINLEEINIPDSVIEIEESAFSCCSKLQRVKLSKNLKFIDTKMFYECNSLKEVDIPNGIVTIFSKAFSGCYSLTRINLPDTLIGIGSNAFENCFYLQEIIIPENVIHIGDYAFSRCSSLKNVKLSENIEKISQGTFSECTSLENIKLPTNLRKIESFAFSTCKNLEKITIPEGITSIECYLFFHCYSLKKVTLSSNIKDIKDYAFCYCTSLEYIKLPNNLKTIGDHVFYECESLKKIDIPSSVTSIRESAFAHCPSLKEIKINNPYCDIKCSTDSTSLKWMYIKKDGTMIICKNRIENKNNKFIEVDLLDQEASNFFDTNYRVNYVKVHKMKKEGKINFIPPEYTLTVFPNSQIDKYFINNNNKKWKELVIQLGFDKLKGIEKDNSLTDLMKIYYAIGGFSTNTKERDEAYDYIINYVAKTKNENATPNEIGAAIHARFSILVLKDEYNKEFAKFFMRYYKDNPHFMNFSFDNVDGMSYEQDYLCIAHNNFENILKNYPNRVVNGNEERALLTPEFVAEHCSIISYDDVEEGNEELAKLVGRYGYTQEQFEYIQRIYNKAKKIKDKAVIQANKDNEENSVTYRLLEKDDPLGFVLGDITNCCQRIDDAASSCVEDGYKNPNAGFMVFEEKETGRILAQAYIWYDEKTKTVCYDNIEIPTKVLDGLKKQSSKVKTEDLLNAIEKSAESIMEAMNKDGIKVERVTTGKGYNDLKNELEKHYKKEENPKALRGDNIYTDARDAQYIIKTYDEITRRNSEEIKENLEEANKTIDNIRIKKINKK